MKSIFELSTKEGKKVESEFKKSSYFKQYSICTVCSILALVFGVVGYVVGYVMASEGEKIEQTPDFMFLAWVILFSAIIFMSLLLNFKKFDLIKKYYEEVYSKKEK